MGIPKDERKDLAGRVLKSFSDVVEERAALANLSSREFMAKVIVQWGLSGGAPVDQNDERNITPEMRKALIDAAEQTLALYDWAAFIDPRGEIRAGIDRAKERHAAQMKSKNGRASDRVVS